VTGAALLGEAAAPAGGRRRRYVVAATGLVAAGAAAAGSILATRDGGPPRPVAISQNAIAGVGLGMTKSAYKHSYGVGYREDVFTLPNFDVLIFQYRKLSVYFDRTTRRAIIITTWNRNYRTSVGVGPCSSIQQLKSAYGSALRPSRWNTLHGKVYAYTVGKNLLFATNGKPPNPSKFVTGVALYDGDGPRDDGNGVDVSGGTLPFAGFVALNETPCT
jgi:hypothetical protein